MVELMVISNLISLLTSISLITGMTTFTLLTSINLFWIEECGAVRILTSTRESVRGSDITRSASSSMFLASIYYVSMSC